MRKTLIFATLLALACFGFAGTANADSTTAGGVVYTFTSGEDDGGGVFDVVLTIDTTGATASGTLSVFAVQFGGSTNAVLESQTNTSGWSVVGPGNVNQCGTGNLPFWCVSGGSIGVTSGGPGAVYTFTFDVTAPSAPTDGDIQAFQGQGDLAISNEVGIGGPPPSVPEPASLTLVGLGLLGVPFLRRRK